MDEYGLIYDTVFVIIFSIGVVGALISFGISHHKNAAQRGSVFFALFASVAMVGVIGAATVSFIRGPLATSVKVTRQNSAETQLSMAMRLAAVASATQQPSNGDCDGDGYIEPIPYRNAGAAPHPTGGGLIPLTIGAAKADPWQRDFGYCVFDHGPTVDHASCGGPSQARQKGANSGLFPALAMISAGPDGVFQTVCNDWADANLDGVPDVLPISTAPASDDIVFAWTYAEASGAVDGLWKLKAGDASTAEIDRNLSVKDGGGIEQFSFNASTGALALGAGGSGSFPTVKTDYLDALTAPAIEVLAPINATEPFSMGGTEIIDETGQIVHGEQDPNVGTVTNGKWCKGGAGGVLTCEENAVGLDCQIVTATALATSVSVNCPAGRIVTGGGCQDKAGANMTIRRSFPNGPTVWTCLMETGTTEVTGYAICCQ